MKTIFIFNANTKEFLGAVESSKMGRLQARDVFAKAFNLDRYDIETSLKPVVNRNGSY